MTLELSPRLDNLGAVAKEARVALGTDTQVVLSVPVNAHTYRRLPDVVRWVDDRLSDIAGLSFTLDGAPAVCDASDFVAWWEATRHACEVREVGCLIAQELPGAPGPGLKLESPTQRPEPHPELLTTWPRPQTADMAASITALMEGVGTLARFVNLPRLTEAHPKMLAYVRQDPRDMARYERHSASTQLRTLIHASEGVRDDLIEGVRRVCEDLDSEVIVASGQDPTVTQALDTFTARITLDHVQADAYLSVT